ncbi:hypothetical protein HK101_003846 [Irineochytrium annulatum]|nr:hypothetical protein HK101_003846 [Irineochytrium annulatum]
MSTATTSDPTVVGAHAIAVESMSPSGRQRRKKGGGSASPTNKNGAVAMITFTQDGTVEVVKMDEDILLFPRYPRRKPVLTIQVIISLVLLVSWMNKVISFLTPNIFTASNPHYPSDHTFTLPDYPYGNRTWASVSYGYFHTCLSSGNYIIPENYECMPLPRLCQLRSAVGSGVSSTLAVDASELMRAEAASGANSACTSIYIASALGIVAIPLTPVAWYGAWGVVVGRITEEKLYRGRHNAKSVMMVSLVLAFISVLLSSISIGVAASAFVNNPALTGSFIAYGRVGASAYLAISSILADAFVVFLIVWWTWGLLITPTHDAIRRAMISSTTALAASVSSSGVHLAAGTGPGSAGGPAGAGHVDASVSAGSSGGCGKKDGKVSGVNMVAAVGEVMAKADVGGAIAFGRGASLDGLPVGSGVAGMASGGVDVPAPMMVSRPSADGKTLVDSLGSLDAAVAVAAMGAGGGGMPSAGSGATAAGIMPRGTIIFEDEMPSFLMLMNEGGGGEALALQQQLLLQQQQQQQRQLQLQHQHHSADLGAFSFAPSLYSDPSHPTQSLPRVTPPPPVNPIPRGTVIFDDELSNGPASQLPTDHQAPTSQPPANGASSAWGTESVASFTRVTPTVAAWVGSGAPISSSASLMMHQRHLGAFQHHQPPPQPCYEAFSMPPAPSPISTGMPALTMPQGSPTTPLRLPGGTLAGGIQPVPANPADALMHLQAYLPRVSAALDGEDSRLRVASSWVVNQQVVPGAAMPAPNAASSGFGGGSDTGGGGGGGRGGASEGSGRIKALPMGTVVFDDE